MIVISCAAPVAGQHGAAFALTTTHDGSRCGEHKWLVRRRRVGTNISRMELHLGRGDLAPNMSGSATEWKFDLVSGLPGPISTENQVQPLCNLSNRRHIKVRGL